jgi:transcriptional regulator GlxA family with amidase domain
MAMETLASTGARPTGTRVVQQGKIITAAGVSAGIDMALHLVARLESVEQAQAVRRYIQYDPRPPV